MKTQATTIKCIHLVYDTLIDMFQYENNSYELCDVCTGLILSSIKVSGVVDEPHIGWSFGIKWHNMAESAMNDWLMKGTVQFVEM